MEEKINKLLSCDNCPYPTYSCEQCEISQTDKMLIREYIENLIQRNKELEERLKDSVSKETIRNRIEELNKQEKEASNSISDEEREEYSNANISFILMDIDIRRSILEELLEDK